MRRRFVAFVTAALLATVPAFAQPVAPVVIPFDLVDGHIFVDVRIDGSGPYRFAVDTGASGVVASDVAARLGMRGSSSYALYGTGEHAERASEASVSSLELSGVVLHDQKVTLLDFSELRAAEGLTGFDGLIGHELFDRYTVEIDYASRTMTLRDRADVPAAGPGDSVVPLHFLGTMPEVRAKVDDDVGQFTVDTGDRGSLTLLADFVKQNDIADRYPPSTEGIAGWGIGGAVRARLLRVDRFSIGQTVVARPVTRLPESEHGFFASNSVAGNIGSGILRRFDVTFDYARSQMVLHPNSAADSPDLYDRSGMWLVLAPGGFRVAGTLRAGPAERAGLREGDVIETIDGRDALGIGLVAERERLRTLAAGSVVMLSVRRGDSSQSVPLRLADVV